MTDNKGRLYLIPSPIGDGDPAEVIPAPVLALLQDIDTYVVEEVRTARRYLSRAGLKGHIEELQFHTLNEHTRDEEVERMASLFDGGRNVGLISEAGLPAVADPGARLVELCHRIGVKVIPQVGPSSLMMALMSSGLNGQSFAFCGYLPAKTDERGQAIRAVERRSAELRQSQIIIETPYRNDALFADMLRHCSPSTRICIAADISCEDAFIKTKTAGEWKRDIPVIGKRPCVFVMLAHK